MAEQSIQLTKLASCAGCGAKVGAGVLAQLLGGLKVHSDPRLLVGFDKSDDASVYQVTDELALVQTVDFFPPIADDPYLFGQIAATNALSDVYAMGGEPKLALNLLCIPWEDQQVVQTLHLCDAHNVPMATNLATAEMLILGLQRGDLDWREMIRRKRSVR